MKGTEIIYSLQFTIYNLESENWIGNCVNSKYFLFDRVYLEPFPDKQLKTMDRITLEARLVDFSIKIIDLCQCCEYNEFTQHLLKHIVRSSSSSALNYGEAQSAESRADFAHKLSLVLKELREQT